MDWPRSFIVTSSLSICMISNQNIIKFDEICVRRIIETFLSEKLNLCSLINRLVRIKTLLTIRNTSSTMGCTIQTIMTTVTSNFLGTENTVNINISLTSLHKIPQFQLGYIPWLRLLAYIFPWSDSSHGSSKDD